MKNTTPHAPRLAPPGAGIPLPQLLMARYYLGPFVAGRSDWEKNMDRFDMLNAKLLKAVEGLSTAHLTEKVLVPTQPGLEDSSRYWSIAMALEHLTHVGLQIREAIVLLSKGTVPPVVVDIAKVKPLGEMPATKAVEDFQRFATETRAYLQKHVADRASRSTLTHPWFGPFRAQQWEWLLAAHAGIHYKQIKEIKKRLE